MQELVKSLFEPWHSPSDMGKAPRQCLSPYQELGYSAAIKLVQNLTRLQMSMLKRAWEDPAWNWKFSRCIAHERSTLQDGLLVSQPQQSSKAAAGGAAPATLLAQDAPATLPQPKLAGSRKRADPGRRWGHAVGRVLSPRESDRSKRMLTKSKLVKVGLRCVEQYDELGQLLFLHS